MRHINTATTVSLVIWMASACAAVGSHARIVRADRYGGEVALSGTYMDRAADALLVMAEHCDGRFRILAPAGTGTQYIDAPDRDQRWVDFECVGVDEPALAVAGAPRRAADEPTARNAQASVTSPSPQ